MRLIDADSIKYKNITICGGHGLYYDEKIVYDNDIAKMPTVDAIPVDLVAKMLYEFAGDLCPCNYSPWDEWLSERCELQDECPNPSNELGCWKQFIKHYAERRTNNEHFQEPV